MVTKDEMRQRAKKRMDIVENMMDSNMHLTDPEVFLLALDKAKALWWILDEEDKDYLDAATFAFGQKMTWAVKKETNNEKT